MRKIKVTLVVILVSTLFSLLSCSTVSERPGEENYQNQSVEQQDQITDETPKDEGVDESHEEGSPEVSPSNTFHRNLKKSPDDMERLD